MFDAFWTHFKKQPSGCWEWTGARIPKGYGVVWDPRVARQRGVHVVAYELHHSVRVAKGQVVRHAVCDNPPCGNPAHLAIGVARDNIHDAVRKGRHAHGAGQAGAKLTERDAADAKALLADGVPLAAVARLYGLRDATVADLKAGRTWQHVLVGVVTPALRARVQKYARWCRCGCGRALQKSNKYGWAWGCSERPVRPATALEEE